MRAALSSERMATYEVAAGTAQGDAEDLSALVLYAWNANISSALLAPLHICEVVIRNAVADALEAVYGPLWPWSQGFERSLPDSPQGYSSRKEIQSVRRSAETTGSLIPELKFVFWQKMFTGRFDDRIWNNHLLCVFPNLDKTLSIATLRQNIYNDLEQLRKLRNRIAHHEPIFTRSLDSDYHKVIHLIQCRCIITADWMCENQNVTEVLAVKPSLVKPVPKFLSNEINNHENHKIRFAN